MNEIDGKPEVPEHSSYHVYNAPQIKLLMQEVLARNAIREVSIQSDDTSQDSPGTNVQSTSK